MRLPTILALLALSFVTPASAGWPRLPTLDKRSVGMELAYAGTTLQSATGMVDASALIMGDPKKSAKLEAGRGEAIFKFAGQSFIQNLSFVADGIQGKVSLSISPDDKTWTPLGDAFFASADRLVKMDVGRAQGRYVKLSFELSKGGSIRGIQMIGLDSDANYIAVQEENGAGAPVNFAAGIGGGRLIYLSDNAPGAGVDALRSNCFKFTTAGQKFRTAVYDLGQERMLNEFGSIHSSRPVRFSVFAFKALPEKENWRGRVAFDDAVFVGAKPVATAEDKTGRGNVTVKPAQVVKSRYIALRWETDVTDSAFDVYRVAVTGMANIFFQNAQLSATTVRDADGNIVTRLRSNTADMDSADVELAMFVKNSKTAAGGNVNGLAWNDGGATAAGLLFSSYYKGGGGGPNGSGRRKEEVVEGEDPPDPDEDPPAVQIIWCEAASP